MAAIAAAPAASAFAREGRSDSARRAAARSRELCARCDGGPPPVLKGVEAGEVVLTRRERQLVSQAARGLTNAEIADQLVLFDSHEDPPIGQLGRPAPAVLAAARGARAQVAAGRA